MKATNLFLLSAAALLSAAPVMAQEVALAPTTTDSTPKATAPAPAKKSAAEARKSLLRPIDIQHIRPLDQRGLLVFESPKDDNVAWDGFKLSWGAAFTQQFQHLGHSNTADSIRTSATDATNKNRLIGIGSGFNNAVANLYLNAQMAPGIRVALTSYLSSRHHQETWVKDGYLLVDGSPIDWSPLNKLMEFTTIKAGHYEINYGDQHFRRTDNGNALYNPFVGNMVMDAFTTEIGGEVMLRKAGFFGIGGMTGGEVKGSVTQANQRSPSYIAKVGFDKQVLPIVRFRLTGSTYQNGKSASNTLYSGDRGGSRYYLVLENSAATTNAAAWSGAIQPGFSNAVRAYVVNPFIKVKGLEYFGNFESATGKKATEATERTWKQNSNEVVFRFLPAEQAYVGYRYNTAKGQLQGIANDVKVTRSQTSLGWFMTPSILLKGEYVNQKYTDFPTTDIRNGGKFNGFMVEGVLAF